MQIAAVASAMLLGLVGVFQFRLASGAPMGDMAYGGRAPTTDGVLTGPFRAMSALAVAVLLFAAWLVVAAAGVIDAGSLTEGFLRTAVWIVVGYLALNTLANLSSTNQRERIVMGTITGLATVMTLVVALSL